MRTPKASQVSPCDNVPGWPTLSIPLWSKCVKANFLQDNSTSDWSPRQAPGTEVLDVRSPASVIPCSWHTSFPQTPLLQKKLPCRRHTYPPASHADPCRSWNPCSLWDAQLKHLLEKCPPGRQVYWIYWCFQPTACIALQTLCIALRCIDLNFKLHVCNLIYPRPLIQ